MEEKLDFEGLIYLGPSFVLQGSRFSRRALGCRGAVEEVNARVGAAEEENSFVISLSDFFNRVGCREPHSDLMSRILDFCHPPI